MLLRGSRLGPEARSQCTGSAQVQGRREQGVHRLGGPDRTRGRASAGARDEARVAEEGVGRGRAAAEHLKHLGRGHAAAQGQHGVAEAAARGPHRLLVVQPRILKRREAVRRENLLSKYPPPPPAPITLQCQFLLLPPEPTPRLQTP